MSTTLTRRAAFFLALGGGSAAQASVGEPYGVGYANPTELARTVRKSFVTDPDGKYPVNSTRCLPNGYSCASARQYLEGFQKADPGAGLRTVDQLPGYLETLVEGYPEGDFWMSCLVKGTRREMWDCLSRPLDKGERAWMNPKTGKFVLAGKCTNPMGEKVPPKDRCVEIHYWLEVNDEVHIALLGPEPLPNSKCLAILKAGETEWSNVLLDECPRRGCDYSGPVKDLNLALQPDIRVSYKAQVAGWHKLRLPAFMLTSKDVVAFCVIKPDRTQTRSSIIGRDKYFKNVAYLGYAQRDDVFAPKGAFLSTYVWDKKKAPAR